MGDTMIVNEELCKHSYAGSMRRGRRTGAVELGWAGGRNRVAQRHHSKHLSNYLLQSALVPGNQIRLVENTIRRPPLICVLDLASEFPSCHLPTTRVVLGIVHEHSVSAFEGSHAETGWT